MAEGLLGFAFDPDYAKNGFFFVYYSHGLGKEMREHVIARFTAKDHVADPASEKIVMQIKKPKPWGNHNGGTIIFGPDKLL